MDRQPTFLIDRLDCSRRSDEGLGGCAANAALGGGEARFVGVRVARSERELDSPRADPDEAGELEQLEPDRAAGRLGELGVGAADASDRADQNLSERGKPEPELVGAHGGGRGAVGGRPGVP